MLCNKQMNILKDKKLSYGKLIINKAMEKYWEVLSLFFPFCPFLLVWILLIESISIDIDSISLIIK